MRMFGYRGVNSDWYTAFKGNYRQFISFNIHCNHHWSSHCMAESLKLILKISTMCISACYLRAQCVIFKTNVKSGTIPKLSWIEEFQRLRLIFEEILKFRRQQESPRTYCELSKRRVRSASYCYIAENSVWRGLPARFLARATCKCLPSGDWCMLWNHHPPSPPASSLKQPPNCDRPLFFS